MAYLVVSCEGTATIRRPLDEPMILGRALDCGIWLDDKRLSRHHCRFEQQPDGAWAVIDLNSSNGTIVAGQPISLHKLRDGEEIQVGRARVVYHADPLPRHRPADPGASRTGEPAAAGQRSATAPSPSDTLLDSRLAMPSPKPNSKHQHRPPTSVSVSELQAYMKPAAPTAPEVSADVSDNPEMFDEDSDVRPLAFKRPPARPTVPGAIAPPRRGFLGSLLNRLRGGGNGG